MLRDEDKYLIKVEKEDDITIIEITGSVLVEYLREFERDLDRYVNEKKVIFNLEHTDFISSSGLGAILKFTKEVRANGGDVYIASPKQFVLKALKVTQISSIIQVFSTLESAIDSMVLKDL